MTRESVRDLLKRRPFRPIRLRLSSGETHDIRHPELVLVLKTDLIIANPKSDRFVVRSMLHITSVESLQAA